MSKDYDVLIIGSGFGGTMTAKKLIDTGLRVAILERGDWVKRGPQNWATEGSIDLTPQYDKTVPYNVIKGGNKPKMGVYSAVGGPSLFYGGVSFRFREDDFNPPADIVTDSGAEWPINYHDLEPYYTEAEALLNIAGDDGADPTAPPRSVPYPQQPADYADISKKIKSSAESLGCRPFHLPLAINYHDRSRQVCQLCTTCDTFTCAIGAKNDLEMMILRGMSENQVDIIPNAVVTKINQSNGTFTSVSYFDKTDGQVKTLNAKACVLSAGALASPHILLNSALDSVNPAGDLIGRYLMRHVNAIVFGIFTSPPDKQKRFHKELAILDYYFGHEDIDYPKHKIGSLQQVPTPPSGLVKNEAPKPLGPIAASGVKLLTGLLAIAEDQPQYENQISIDKSNTQEYGLAKPIVSHAYTERDQKAVRALTEQAKKIMKKSGALINYVHHIKTFSHSAGTVRMGKDPSTSPLDKDCRFRGVDNLYVVDACFMPSSAAVNPSLTISANALRVGEVIAKSHNFANLES